MDDEKDDDVLRVRVPLDDTIKRYYLCSVCGEESKTFVMPMTDKEKHCIDKFVECSTQPIFAGNFRPYVTILSDKPFDDYNDAVNYYIEHTDEFS